MHPCARAFEFLSWFLLGLVPTPPEFAAKAAEAEASAGTAPVDGFGGLLLWASEVAHGSRKSSLANVAQAAELGAHVEAC